MLKPSLFLFAILGFKASWALSPQDFVAAGLQNSGLIQISALDTVKNQIPLKFRPSQDYPQLDLFAEAALLDSNLWQNREQSRAMHWGARSNWTLYAGGQSALIREGQKLALSGAQIQYQIQVQKLSLELWKLYAEGYLNQATLNAQAQRRQSAEMRLKIAEQRLSAGKAAPKEVLEAQLELNAVESDALSAQMAWEQSKLSLEMHLAKALTDSLESPLLQTQSPKGQNLAQSQAQWQSQTMANALAKTQSNWRPKLDLQSSYSWSAPQSSSFWAGKNGGAGLGLVLSWNLFRGYADQALQKQAEIDLKQAQIGERELQKNLHLQEQILQQKLSIAQKKIALEQSNLKAALDLQKQSLSMYQEGKILGTEVQIAIQNANLYQTRLLAAQSEWISHSAELYALWGQL